MIEKNEIYFREVQRFTQIWVMFLVAIPVVIAWYGAIQQLILHKPFGNNPASDPFMIVIWIVFGFLFPIFFLSVKFVTEIKKDGIYILFFPFHLKFRTMPFPSIQSYFARDYSPFKDYGGYGIRYGKQGRAYNVKGKRGVQLNLMSGSKIMIGSQKADELVEAINRAKK